MTCLIVHPQNNVNDFLTYSSIVRYICSNNEPNIEVHYVVLKKFEQYIDYLYSGIDVKYILLEELSDNSVLRLLMGDHKNTKDRQFFGYFDKYRFDKFKGIFQSCVGNETKFDPYQLYEIEPSVWTNYFSFTRNARVEKSKWQNSLARFKFKYNAISSIKGFRLPKINLTETTLNVYLDSMFEESNFFESMIVIMNASKLYLRHTDVFTFFVYLLHESGSFSSEKSKTIHLFHQGEDDVPFKIPSCWKQTLV